METIDIVAGPVAEPVTLNDVKLELGFGPMQDSDRAASQLLNDQLRNHIVTARDYCEGWCRRVFVTQTWQLLLDSFPSVALRYDRNGYPEIWLPKPPFQSVVSFTYVDTSGATQTLTQDASYGVNLAAPFYGYQLSRGSRTQPARLLPPWARPWAPQRMVPDNTVVRFRCGYGGPITCSMTAGSAVLTVSGGAPLSFDADDAPLLPQETGLPIFVPGAGPTSGTVISPITNHPVTGALATNIASVNPSNGQATLAAVATTTVTNVPGWAGRPVPARITHAIRRLAAYCYDNRGESVAENEEFIQNLLKPFRNDVS